MALLSPKFNSLGYQKKTKKQREAEKQRFEQAYQEEQQRLAALQPNFSNKYGPAKKKSIKKSKIPSYASLIPEDRNTRHIESVVDLKAPAMVIKRSAMDPRELAKEAPEVQEATLAKSRSIAPMYNKGGDQYVTPGIDVTTIGARSRRP